MIHIKIKANGPKIWAALLRCLMSWPTNGWKDLESKQTNKQKNGFTQITIVKFHSRHYDLAQQENHRWTK